MGIGVISWKTCFAYVYAMYVARLKAHFNGILDGKYTAFRPLPTRSTGPSLNTFGGSCGLPMATPDFPLSSPCLTDGLGDILKRGRLVCQGQHRYVSASTPSPCQH